MIPARFTSAHSLPAAGTDQGSATALTKENVDISGGSGGVRLSSALGIPSGVHRGGNRSGAAVNIYPETDESINGKAANLPVSLDNLKGFVAFHTGQGNWTLFIGDMPT